MLFYSCFWKGYEVNGRTVKRSASWNFLWFSQQQKQKSKKKNTTIEHKNKQKISTTKNWKTGEYETKINKTQKTNLSRLAIPTKRGHLLKVSVIHRYKDKEGLPENGAMNQKRSRAKTPKAFLPLYAITTRTKRVSEKVKRQSKQQTLKTEE